MQSQHPDNRRSNPATQSQAPPTGSLQRWGKWENNRHYSLEVVQHPERARMCGFGDRDRRPLAPAVIASMVTRDESNNIVDADDVEISFFLVTCDLWSADGTTEVNLVRNPSSQSANRKRRGEQQTPSYPASEDGDGSPPYAPGPSSASSASGKVQTGQDIQQYSTPVQYPVAGQPASYGSAGSASWMSSAAPGANWGGGTNSSPEYEPSPGGQTPQWTGGQMPGYGEVPENYPSTNPMESYDVRMSAIPSGGGHPTSQTVGSSRPQQDAGFSSDYTRTLVGPLSAGAARLLDEHGAPGIFFTFQDLSVRTEGQFRLRLRLMNIGSPGGTRRVNEDVSPVLAQTYTNVFTVYSAKKFPGVPKMTPLSRAFARQGQKLPLRQKAGSREGGRGQEGESDDQEDEERTSE
ncbi:hypothetical protein FRC02_012017 [Tulasnella sp. 418]|nr:hypothetical protein FRC02_012017 [Tulasnella sp. 418]